MMEQNLNIQELTQKIEEYERNNEFDRMIQYLNLGLQKDPTNKNFLLKILDYYLNDANPSRALKTLEKLIRLEPDNSVYYKQAITILLEFNKIELAKKLAKIGFSNTNDQSIVDMIKNIENSTANSSITLMLEDFDKETVTLLYSLFSGREGVYARQWKNTEGVTGYIPVKEPLNEKTIINHLNGNITIGIYQHRLDSTINWICFDIDIAKHVLNNALTNNDYFKELDNLCQDIAVEIYDECAKFNIPVYIENSGYKGRHCWIFAEKPINARIAKKFGDTLKANLKKIIPEVSLEVFPKQNFVKPDGLGNLVKLPLGIHIATGKRSFFVDRHGKEIKNVNDFLKKIGKTDEKRLIEYLNYYRIETIYSEYSKKSTPPRETISFPQPHKSFNLETDRSFQYIIYKCPVIKELYNNAIKKNELSYNEMIVITHTLGHLENGVEIVNSIFSKCFNVSADKYLKSQLKGNPISCARIRSKIPEITSSVNCNCQFVNTEGLYPSPVLHLNTKEIPSKLPILINVDMLNFQNVLDSYISLKKQYFEISLTLKEYEEKFETLFKTSGVDKINTPIGTFRRVVDENGKISYKIDV